MSRGATVQIFRLEGGQVDLASERGHRHHILSAADHSRVRRGNRWPIDHRRILRGHRKFDSIDCLGGERISLDTFKQGFHTGMKLARAGIGFEGDFRQKVAFEIAQVIPAWFVAQRQTKTARIFERALRSGKSQFGGEKRARAVLRGMAEGGILSVAPSVCNAIARATGVRIKDLPLTPERVWRALRDSGK